MLPSLGKQWNFIPNKLQGAINSSVWTTWNKPATSLSRGDSALILQEALIPCISLVLPFNYVTVKICNCIFFIRKRADCTGWMMFSVQSSAHTLHTTLPYVFSSDKDVPAWGQLLSAVVLLITLQRQAFAFFLDHSSKHNLRATGKAPFLVPDNSEDTSFG